MKIKIVDKAGNAVCESKNLRGMRDYARVSPVAKVKAVHDPANKVRGLLTVEYRNGCTCTASFASYHIMVDFIRNRRTWRNAEFQIAQDIGYLTAPGIIAEVRGKQ